ncbi:hypothetical protein HJC23_012566 [Cyclotella cryptica]|uniref:Uncharacterized protein n=1 Tax=Cyclotella cryptica TaxID=29204 RepID=A0ABD3QQM8_9STRA
MISPRCSNNHIPGHITFKVFSRSTVLIEDATSRSASCLFPSPPTRPTHRPNTLQPNNCYHYSRYRHRQSTQQRQHTTPKNHRQSHLKQTENHHGRPMPRPETMLTRQASGAITFGHGSHWTQNCPINRTEMDTSRRVTTASVRSCASSAGIP